ncbi:IMPACT family protein [Niabella sp. CC-SYL272]|uniref:IMPACT family protein n=1 Tax=Niabella agricola TaxID=2891571 RepID=UPI001F3BB787|nr:YigZ family protein [Niabella agricola]MCF3108448.1 IMPACT family protein [Niabella agricola]
MEQGNYYQTIETSGQAEFKDRGSRFIAIAYPLKNTEEFKSILAAVKKEHPKANHHCFAYRLGTDGNTFRVSDAGEPSGTAGRPILGQIDSRQVTDALIIVVRYFGGTLLGVPGLINAYKSAAAMALQVTHLVRKPVLKTFHLQFDYTQLNEVMNVVKQFDCTIIKQELQLFCVMDIGIPKHRLTETVMRLEDIKNLALKEVIAAV